MRTASLFAAVLACFVAGVAAVRAYDYSVMTTDPRSAHKTLARVIYMQLDHEWKSKMVSVPDIAGSEPVACWQAVEETATMDCFYHGTDADDKNQVMLMHLAVDPKDLVE